MSSDASRASPYISRFALSTYGGALAGAVLAVLSSRGLPWNTSRSIGICLWVPSAILWIIARLQLGTSFSVKAEARTLVTRGLYYWIQHPIYLFGSTLIFGLILFLGKPWYLLAFCVIVPLQLLRIRRERRVLTEAFGDQYRQYRKTTWL